MFRPPEKGIVFTIILLVLTLTSAGLAQRTNFGLPRWIKNDNLPRIRSAERADNGFVFCRLKYTSVRREPDGHGWSTDYPNADRNFMIRLSELTKTSVDFEDKGDLHPNYWVVEATDPNLFRCPFIIASDVGTMGLDDDEVDALREYLLKGGFLWVDDFWGYNAWDQWLGQIRRVLPSEEYPIFDVPLNHEILKILYNIWEIPQVSHIEFWHSHDKETSERGWESEQPNFLAIQDKNDRLMVVMTHNTDIQDSWERETEDPEFFEEFAPSGYSLGVNILLYAMSH